MTEKDINDAIIDTVLEKVITEEIEKQNEYYEKKLKI